MKNYKKLKIWQQGITIVKKTYWLTNKLPEREKYNLVAQMNRASVSIPSNIAEGSSRKSEKDFNRFLQIALGSSFELDTQCEVIKELYEGFDDELDDLQNIIDEECRMIQGLINRVSEK
ncbi:MULTISPECIES: four helix bundle protein [unclassified Carboxylicivirga]|uniref:four helix bundle protein n=1 Tax=Carboxylicivirga TaxID=1628153 RepID=UPI003D342902